MHESESVGLAKRWLMADEGLTLKRKRDVSGNGFVVGWGWWSEYEGGLPESCTKEEADEWLLDWIEVAVSDVKAVLKARIILDAVREAALICCAYVLGFKYLGEFTDMLVAVRTAKWEKAASELLDSEWHAKGPAGVRLRIGRLAAMLESGVEDGYYEGQ